MNLGSVRDYDELVRRLVFTAVILVVYRFGAQLPLPGVAADALSQLRGAAPDHISILALGITPFVTVVIFVELLKVIVPALRKWELASARNQSKLGTIVVGVALLAAAAQASGLVLAMEDVKGLVATPGTGFRLIAILTLVAGTATVIWLADQITRHGLGSGIWILLITPWVSAVPYKVIAWLMWPGNALIILLGVIVSVGFTLLILATIIALMSAGGASHQFRQTWLWSVLLGKSVWPWLLIVVALLIGGGLDPTTLVSLVFLTALVALFVHLYLRSWRIGGKPLKLKFTPTLMATAIGGVTLADILVATSLPGLVPLAGHSIVITVVMLEILQRWWQPPFSAQVKAGAR